MADTALSYGDVFKRLKLREIKTIFIKPGSDSIVCKLADETSVPATVVVNDLLIKKASAAQADIVITKDKYQAWPSIAEVITILSGVAVFIMVAMSVISQQRMMAGGGQGGSIQVVNSSVGFSDVAGIDDARGELMEIVKFIKSPAVFAAAGALLPRGCLLHGPPGTGKTLLARAIAGEAGVPFIAVSASEFMETYVGVGAARVRQLFSAARAVQPSIIFIDEIDSVGAARDSSTSVGSNSERDQTLNQLLSEMDGFDRNHGVVVVAATNRKYAMDGALLRPGRFDRIVAVHLPDMEGRTRILGVHARNKYLDHGVNLRRIADATAGCSGADLANIMNEAAIQSVGNGPITEAHLMDSIEKVLIGVKSTRRLTRNVKRIVAHHEAGHAVMGVLLQGPSAVRRVTIIPRGDAGGVTMFGQNGDGVSLFTSTQLRDRMVIALGGTVAEEIALGDVSVGATSDLVQVERIAKAMVRDFGMGSSKILSENKINKEKQRIVDQVYQRTVELISAHNASIKAVATELMEVESMTGDGVSWIISSLR